MIKKLTKRRKPDWELIEKSFRLDQFSIREIARRHNINVSSITRKAKKEGWVRDKTEEVRHRTKMAMLKQQGSNKKQHLGNVEVTREDIDLAVETNIVVLSGHRKAIGNGQKIVDILQGHLLDATITRDELEEEVVDATAEDLNTNRRNQMLKAISLPAHAAVAKDLSVALKNLVGLERVAYSLDDSTDPTDDLKSTLTTEEKSLFRKAARIVSQRVIDQAHE
jgi:transposase-like protein